MKKLTYHFTYLTISLLIFTQCSSFNVITDLDPTEDFESLKKFEFAGWAEDSDQTLSRFERQRIESAFGDELRKRGIEIVESNGDAIAVLYVLKNIRTEKVANTTTTGMGMGGMGMGMGGWGRAGMMGPGWGWGMGHSTSQTRVSEQQFLEGTLVAEVYDTKRKNLVWMAVGTSNNLSKDPKKREKKIPKAIESMMKDYPVAPQKDK
jgi:hypothetical protein